MGHIAQHPPGSAGEQHGPQGGRVFELQLCSVIVCTCTFFFFCLFFIPGRNLDRWTVYFHICSLQKTTLISGRLLKLVKTPTVSALFQYFSSVSSMALTAMRHSESRAYFTLTERMVRKCCWSLMYYQPNTGRWQCC